MNKHVPNYRQISKNITEKKQFYLSWISQDVMQDADISIRSHLIIKSKRI